MSAINSVNWALVCRRLIWTGVWVAMMALLVVMCKDLAADQPVIFGLVLLAAFVGSISFPYMRVSWKNGARATAVVAFVIGVTSVLTHAVLEGSYWSGVISEISDQVAREKAQGAARDVVAEKRKERYEASSSGKSAAQLDAELKSARQDWRWSASESCVKSKANSREFCKGYFLIEAQLAAAKEAGSLEAVVWDAGTSVEGTGKRNLADIAISISKAVSVNSETFSLGIVLLLVAFTQFVLAGALLIGYAPEKPREAATATKDEPAILTGTKFSPPVLPYPVRQERRALDGTLEKLTGAKANLPEIPVSSIVANIEPASNVANIQPEPDGDGTPVAKPDIEPAEEPDDTRKVVNLFPNDSTPPEAPRGKKKGHKPEAKAEAWLASSTSQTDDTKDQVSSADCWKSYLAYCDSIDRKPLHRKQFSQQIGVLLGRKSGKSRKRDKHGVIFTGLMINPIVAQASKKMRAA